MKKFLIISVILLLVASAAFSQAPPLQRNNAYGFRFKRIGIDSMFNLPVRCDTIFNAGDRANLRSGSTFWDSCINVRRVFYNNSWHIDSTSGGGGSVNLDSLRDANSVTITNPGGTSAKILAVDIPSNKAGVMTVQMKRILDSTVTRIERQNDSVRNYYNSLGVLIFKDTLKIPPGSSFVYKSLSDLRSLGSYDTGKIYRVITNYTIGDFYWVPGCTDPEDSVMNLHFVSGCLKRYYESYVLANWWPIKDDAGVTDNTYYMNKIKTFMRSQTKANRVAFLPGDYAFDNWFWTRDDNADGQFDFITFSLEGFGAAPYATSQVVGPTTILRKFSPQGFLIGWQQGRNIHLKNLHFQGFANVPGTYDQANTWPTSSWLYSGVTNGRYNPDNVLILIDPVHSSVTAPNRYSAISSLYTPTGSSGTSFVSIDNCAFAFSNVAIGLSFNGTTLNGDNIILNNCVQTGNRVFFASGENQTRSNAINGLYSTGGTQKLIDCSSYGAQQGSPPALNFCNIAGITKQLYDFNGAFAQLSITGGYFEGFHTMGKAGALPVQVVGAHFKPLIPSDNGTFAPLVFAEGTSLNFTNSTLQWFDNTWAAGLPFNVNNLSFKSSTIWGGVPTNKTYQNQSIVFDGVTFRNQFGESNITDNNFISDLSASQVNGLWLLPGMKFQMANNKLVMESYDDKIQIKYLESHTIDIDTTTHTATFTATNIAKYQLYDLIWIDNAITDTIDGYSATQTSLGWVSNIAGSVVTLKGVPFGVNEATTYNMYHARLGKFKNRVIGDVTSGSNVITNTKSTQAHFVVGDKIHGTGIPDGYYVTNVNAGASTITISGNATATNTGVELYDTKIVAYARNSDPVNVSADNPGFFRGDIIYNTLTVASTDTVERWVVKSPGFNGTANLPTFGNIKFNTGGGGGGGSDHNALSNLTVGDVHTQYAFLGGRSGGQILKGGTGATDVLSLYGTSGAGTGSTAAIQFGVGTNGASKAMTIFNNSQVAVNRLTTGGYNFLVEGIGGFTNGGFGSSITYEGSYLNVANGSNDFSLRITAYGKRFDIGLSNTKFRIQPMIDNTIPFGIMSTTKDLLLFDFAADSIKAYAPFIVNAGAKFKETVIFPASTTAASSMILAPGVIPSAPVAGAFGFNSSDTSLFYRYGSTTFKFNYSKPIVAGDASIRFGYNSDPAIPDSIFSTVAGGASNAAIQDSIKTALGGKINARVGGGIALPTLSGGGTGNAVETISWAEYLSGNHTTMYIDSIRVDQATNELVVYYPTASDVVYVIPYTDDQFGNVGIFPVGPGVGVSSARFKIKKLINPYMILKGNGSTWDVSGEYNANYSISYNSTTGAFTLSTSDITSQILTDANSQGMLRGFSWSDTTTAYYNVRKFGQNASRGFYELKFDLRDGNNNVFTGAPASTNEFYISLPTVWAEVELRTFDSRSSQQNRNYWTGTNIFIAVFLRK